VTPTQLRGFTSPTTCFRDVRNNDGRRRGGRGDLGLRHAHGRGESPAPDVGGRRPGVPRGPALHERELQGGGSEGLLQRPPAELPEGFPRQRRHVPQLRESDEDVLPADQVTSLRGALPAA